MNPPSKSIAAIVVTYNRADKLSKVLDSILAQSTIPDAILVIDNASTDHTTDVIKSKQSALIKHIILPENIGGAGGFHAGLKTAFTDNYDYFWVMDDDGYPEPGALATLKFSIEEFEARHTWRPSFACSSVRWIDNDLCEMNTPNPVWDWPRFYKDDLPVFLVGSCSFVSVLIPRWAVEKHGLPYKEYFIWYDDAEYTQRLSRSYPGIFCPRSIIIHDTPENKGVNYSLVRPDNVWKFKYGARNEASFRYHTEGKFSLFMFLKRIKREMRQGKVSSKLKWKIYRSALSGIKFNPKADKD